MTINSFQLTEPNPPNKKFTQCPFCGAEGIHYGHHVFNGADKKKSEQYGAIIYPCTPCHTGNTDSIHKQASQEKMKLLKRTFQELIMRKYDMTFEDWHKLGIKGWL